MDALVPALPFEEVISYHRMMATDNASGVRAVVTLAPPGSYRRNEPDLIDTSDLDSDQRTVVRDIYREIDQPYPHVRCATFKDALVVGQGAVVSRDACLIRESVLEFLAHAVTPTGFSTASDDRWHVLPATCRRIATPSLLLKRPWWRNYGHWLIDSATMLALATRMPLPPAWQIVVGQQDDPQMRQVVADTISRLAPGIRVVEHPDDEMWSFEHLIYITPLHTPPLFKHPEGLASLRAILLHTELAAPVLQRRLFVTRGAHLSRRLENEEELSKVAEARGYEVVAPQTLDLIGQATLFQSATHVIGVKGAALANILFCTAGTRCVVMSPGDFPDPFFWDLASHARVSYSEIYGRLADRALPRSHNPFTIQLDRFESLLGR